MKKKRIIGYSISFILILGCIRSFWIMKNETNSTEFEEDGVGRWMFVGILFGLAALIAILKTYTDTSGRGKKKPIS